MNRCLPFTLLLVLAVAFTGSAMASDLEVTSSAVTRPQTPVGCSANAAEELDAEPLSLESLTRLEASFLFVPSGCRTTGECCSSPADCHEGNVGETIDCVHGTGCQDYSNPYASGTCVYCPEQT